MCITARKVKNNNEFNCNLKWVVMGQLYRMQWIIYILDKSNIFQNNVVSLICRY